MTLDLRGLATSDTGFEAEFQRVLHWSAETDAAIEGRVAQIIDDVRTRGDAAVLELTARFDGLQVDSMAALEIGADELRAALGRITPAQRAALEQAAARVRDYHQRQLDACCRSWSYRDADGTLLGQKVTPLDLQIAKCRLSVAVRSDFDYAAAVKQGSRIRVATKYVACARDHFADLSLIHI